MRCRVVESLGRRISTDGHFLNHSLACDASKELLC